MNTKIILLITLVALIFASCSKDDETDTRWKDNNEAAFAKTALSSEYKAIESQSRAGSIAYKVIKSGEGKTPLYTDYVKVLYTGWFKAADWNKDDTYTNEDGNKVKNKYVFDSTADRNDVPNVFQVSQVVDGFSTALQHMKVGDKWEVWMPWKLGYGPASQKTIPAYTTLVFEIELVDIL
ncbi:MAG: FKBP-type peptidyl-prolyl cis-trans isomerase [Candidatus Saccharimonadaceae bacterium]